MARKPFTSATPECKLPGINVDIPDLTMRLPTLRPLHYPLPPLRPPTFYAPPPLVDIPCVPFTTISKRTILVPEPLPFKEPIDEEERQKQEEEEEELKNTEGIDVDVDIAVDECVVSIDITEKKYYIAPTAFELDLSELEYEEKPSGYWTVSKGSMWVRNVSMRCGKAHVISKDMQLTPPKDQSAFDLLLKVSNGWPQNWTKLELLVKPAAPLKDSHLFRSWQQVKDEDFVTVGLYRVRKTTAGLWTKVLDFRSSLEVCNPEPRLWSGKVDSDEKGENVTHHMWVGKAGTVLMRYGLGGKTFLGEKNGWVDITGYKDVYAVADVGAGNIKVTVTDEPPEGKVVGARVGKIDNNLYTQLQHGVISIRPLHDGFLKGGAEVEGNEDLGIDPDDANADGVPGSLGVSDGDSVPVLQLRKFDAPDAHALSYAGDGNFATDQTKRKMLLRVEDGEGKASLKYSAFNPLPPGSKDNTALAWDNTAGGWKAAPPTSAASGGGFRPILDTAAGTVGVSAGYVFVGLQGHKLSGKAAIAVAEGGTFAAWISTPLTGATAPTLETGAAIPSLWTTGTGPHIVPLFEVTNTGGKFAVNDYRGAVILPLYQ